MPAKVTFSFPKQLHPANERVQRMLAACAHYQKSDLPLFVAGYNELCRIDLSGGRALELCCGVGELARELGRVFPKAEVIGMDRYPEAAAALKQARDQGGLSNLKYWCGDALRLTEFADASLDLVFGQATLHHLAHDTDALRKEMARVLKPGGRLVFVFEPLGHNPLWAMIRAWRVARWKMWDESNVVLPQIEEIAQHFATCEVQVFNLLAYPYKFVGRLAGPKLAERVHRADLIFMERWPRFAPMAANFNVVFTK